MKGGEVSRLAALERTLVGAAGRQAERRRRRRRRTVAMLAVAGALTIAAAASVASTQGYFGGVDQQFATLRDDRLIPHGPSAPGLYGSLGALPRDLASRRDWVIAGQRISGYTTASGSFCFRFGTLTGGCVQPGSLSRKLPVAVTVDYGPGTFRVYGLALDGVTSVSLRARGLTRPLLLVRNAVYLSVPSLGGTRPLAGTLIVRMRGGATASLPIRESGGLRPAAPGIPKFPGRLPGGDTAA